MNFKKEFLSNLRIAACIVSIPLTVVIMILPMALGAWGLLLMPIMVALGVAYLSTILEFMFNELDDEEEEDDIQDQA